MNYTILAITAIAVAIVALIKEICDSTDVHRSHIGDAEFRLLLEKQYGNKYF